MLRAFTATTGEFQTPWLRDWSAKLRAICAGRYVTWGLFALGLIRNVILLLAYPPAHGADSNAYFLYAEHLSGYPIPALANVAYPLYSFLILITFHWLGSIYWLIGLQFLMSAAIAPLYYLAIRQFNPALALIAALVILGDMQLGVMFNFTSTEPLYIFLMALALYVLLARVEIVPTNASVGARRASPLHLRNYLPDAAIGLLSVLLMLTRAVGRYLIVPFAIIFFLKTRDWRRTLALLAGFAITLGIYSLAARLLIGQVDGLDTGNYMVGTIMFEHPEWVAAENGPSSQRWVEVRAVCDDYFQFLRCLEDQTGSWKAGEELMSATARETILANLPIYVQTTWQKLLDFLSLSGQAYVDPQLPAAAQCEDIEARLAATSDNSLLAGERGGLLEDPSPETMAIFREKIVAIRTAMCPPLPHSPQLRSLVDFVAFRYRSLGRPQPHLWYGALILLVLILPWARRYWPLLFSLGAVLLNHALISALLSNIQPRYVVVTNPMRAVLLCLLLFLVLALAFRLLDWLLTGRRAASLSAVSQN